MQPLSLPKLVKDPASGLLLEAYSPANQNELWDSIQSDRTHPQRKGNWPGITAFADLTAYRESCAWADFGYSLHHAYEGKGFVSKALRLMENELQKLGFLRGRITCRAWNARSWAVAERAGYVLQKAFHPGRECQGCDDCTRLYEKDLVD